MRGKIHSAGSLPGNPGRIQSEKEGVQALQARKLRENEVLALHRVIYTLSIDGWYKFSHFVPVFADFLPIFCRILPNLAGFFRNPQQEAMSRKTFLFRPPVATPSTSGFPA